MRRNSSRVAHAPIWFGVIFFVRLFKFENAYKLLWGSGLLRLLVNTLLWGNGLECGYRGFGVGYITM